MYNDFCFLCLCLSINIIYVKDLVAIRVIEVKFGESWDHGRVTVRD